jgi:conjugative relaxase-like TrwC/TraI family protein
MVASIKACHSFEYYLNVDHSVYYLDSQLGIGQWYGEGAETLSYRGEIFPEQLANAFAGLSPDGKRSLVQQQTGKQRQPAWDITFSAPKSVSVLWSVSEPAYRDRIERLVMNAAKRAIDYVDSEALIARRGKRGNYIEHAKGVYALCPHGTSRAQDPQLHVHALAMNLCLRADGTTGAIRSWDLYAHKMAAGAVFRIELAHLQQKELGLSISQDSWKFKVDGVPEKLCRELSRRRKAIETIAREEGWNSPRVLAELALRTRDGKAEVSLDECFEHWQATAAKYGFTREAAEALISRGHEATQQANTAQANLKEQRLDRNLAKSVRILSGYKSYFTERDLVRTAATEAVALGYSASDVLESVTNGLDRFEHHVTKSGSAYLHYATKENVSDEKQLLDRASRRRLSTKHVVAADVVTAAKAAIEKRLSKTVGLPLSFTKDQEEALRHITQDPGDVKLVQGYAGTGKTQLLEAAHLAWRQAGYHVLGATITGRAAIGLQNATQIPSVTVAMFLQTLNPSLKDYARRIARTIRDAVKGAYYDSLTAGRWLRNPWKEALREITQTIRDIGKTPPQRMPSCKLTSRSILVLDEAAMIPTSTLLAVKKECDKVGAKLVLVGDRLQLPPIEAGGPFWSLAKRLGHQSLMTIVRQREPWMREAVEHLINDEPLKALKRYAENNALHLQPHRRAAIEKLIADYSKIRPKELPRALALTTTNEEARLINAGVQHKRKAARQLGFFFLKLPSGERIYKNDRVLLTLNDYRRGVRNGFLGTVEAIHRTRGIMGPGSLTVRLDDVKRKGLFTRKPQSVVIDLKKYPHVQLGYAVTTHKVQGITVERSFVLLGDAHASKELLFTQLTRASHASQLYAAEGQCKDSLRFIAEQMSRKTEKDLAHDHAIENRRDVQLSQHPFHIELSHEHTRMF